MSILPEQQSSASNASYTKKKSAEKVVDLKTKEPVRPHFKASLEDAQWVTRQSAPVQHLWIECQIAEHFGANDWREVKTTLKDSTFRKAKVVLEDQGLFKFKAIPGVSGKGRMTVAGWLVHNNHGYYNKQYWEVTSLPTEQPCDTQSDVAPQESTLLPTERPCSVQSEVEPETLAMTEPAKSQPRTNYSSTTHQQPTKVVGGVVVPSIPSEETEETPLGGVPPTMPDGMPGEEPPVAVEVASLGGADVATTHSPSVEDKPEVAGDEPKDPGGDNFSAAAPGAENEKLSVVAAAPPLSEPQANSLLHLDMGSAIRLDFEGHQRHGRYGKIVAVNFEVGEAEVEFRIDQLVMTFPISRLIVVPPTEVEDPAPMASNGREKAMEMIAQLKEAKELDRQQRIENLLTEQRAQQKLVDAWRKEPIFLSPPTLATAHELWADPLIRDQISQEISAHPEWNLEVVDGEIREVPPF